MHDVHDVHDISDSRKIGFFLRTPKYHAYHAYHAVAAMNNNLSRRKCRAKKWRLRDLCARPQERRQATIQQAPADAGLLAKQKPRPTTARDCPSFAQKRPSGVLLASARGSMAERRGKTILGPISGISAALAISLAVGSVSLVALALLSLKNAPPLR
jgi:hypothetical protein